MGRERGSQVANETANSDGVGCRVARGTGSGERALRVMVVDDDEAPREAIARLLESMGCEVTPVSSAQEAVGAFLSRTFDLITLDYRMPGIDGIALHKILSQEFGAGKRTTGFTPRKLPPVVIVTAYPEEPDVISGQFGESVVGVVRKPLIEKHLVPIVGDLMAGAPMSFPLPVEGP